MTIEAKVPLSDLKNVLYCYNDLYLCVHRPIKVYNMKVKVARSTFLSVLFSLVKIFLLAILISVASANSNAANGGNVSNGDKNVYYICLIASIVVGISILLDLIYIQKNKGKKIPKIRFRYTYYISCLVHDIYEFSVFRKYFGVKTPAFFLALGLGKNEAIDKITNWGYLLGEEDSKYIDEYNKKYRDYRDYVNFDKHWSVCGELLDILNSGRASDAQGALAIYDKQKHREQVEYYAMQAAEEARHAADAAWAEASAAEDLAKSQAEQAEYLRQIKDSLR